ncbi:MAG TPA: ribosome maturation factor RimM [Thermomicrobiales bacterium]|nr:ribosome maturation factor RimM [Thermomicrobiales bacterium]
MPEPHDQEPAGPERPGVEAGADGAGTVPAGGRRRPAPKSPGGATRRRTRIGSRALIETDGPAPTDPLADVRLTVGTIGGTHGVAGELKLRLLTDQPDHLPSISRVFLGNSDEPTRLESVRFHGDLALIKLEGVDTPEQGKALGGLLVRIAGEDARPLADDEYFLFQLIGLAAIDEHGAEVGVVTDLIETGAHDVLIITPPGGDRSSQILVPNHPEFVVRIAPEQGVVDVRLPRYE